MTISKLLLPLSFVCALTAANASDTPDYSNLLDPTHPTGVNLDGAREQYDADQLAITDPGKLAKTPAARILKIFVIKERHEQSKKNAATIIRNFQVRTKNIGINTDALGKKLPQLTPENLEELKALPLPINQSDKLAIEGAVTVD